MRDSPIINLSFLMETGHPNCEAKIGEESFHKDDLYDLNTQQYNCRIDEDRKIDQLSEKKIASSIRLKKIMFSHFF